MIFFSINYPMDYETRILLIFEEQYFSRHNQKPNSHEKTHPYPHPTDSTLQLHAKAADADRSVDSLRPGRPAGRKRGPRLGKDALQAHPVAGA